MSPVAGPDRVGPYTLFETLGQGPNGVVYRAALDGAGPEVALKLVTLAGTDDTDSLLRDLRATNDVKAAVSLRHPGIVRVHRVDTFGDQTATEMEYVRGMSLRDLLRITGRLLPERAAAIASQVLDALAYGHARGALHRNLKPTNILIRHDGLARLSDFGFRQSCPDPRSVNAPQVHAYASPEELEPGAAPDRRSDIWSVGIILFQMLTGRLPYPMTDPHDLRAWRRGLKENASAPASSFVSGLPKGLDAVLARAIQTESGARYGTARDFLNALFETGLCAGLAESDEELQERQEATYKRIDDRLRRHIVADEETRFPDLIRAFSETNPGFDDTHALLHYADLLEGTRASDEEPEPHAIGLTPEEVDHLEEIETRLRSLGPDLETAPPDTSSQLESEARTEPPVEDDLSELTWKKSIPAAAAPELTGLTVQKSRPKTLFNRKDGAELVLVPAGEFVMGSNGFAEDNAPQRVVSLDSFCVYRYLVTVGQYRRYCEETAYPMPHGFWAWEEMEPMVGISWHEACAYCAWAEARLPTEAQWEKSARGVDGRAFPWGDQFDQRSDHRLIPKNAGKTLPVGSFPAGASPYGLMDVVGNVQQWCVDLYDDAYYKTSPTANPPGPASGIQKRAGKSSLVRKLFHKGATVSSDATEHRVARGSSWKDHHESFAYAFRRDAFPPESRLPWVGFRCVVPCPAET